MKWQANYDDGTSLMQFEEGKENRYVDIQRDKLSSFAIYSDGGELILSISFERPSQKLIYRKRTLYRPFAEKQYEFIYLCGWHENVNGTSIKSICYLFEDGHIELAGAKDDCQLISQEE